MLHCAHFHCVSSGFVVADVEICFDSCCGSWSLQALFASGTSITQFFATHIVSPPSGLGEVAASAKVYWLPDEAEIEWFPSRVSVL